MMMREAQPHELKLKNEELKWVEAHAPNMLMPAGAIEGGSAVRNHSVQCGRCVHER